MGGIWGLAAAISLKNMPFDARGLFPGILQQGYSIGYLIAAIINLAVVPKSPEESKLFSALVLDLLHHGPSRSC